MREVLSRHASNPRIQLTLRLLGWSAEEPWIPVKRLMCLRWLAWIQPHPPNAPMGRVLNRESIANLLNFMGHLRVHADCF